MNYEILKWDSDFFGFSIGLLTLNKNTGKVSDLVKVLANAKKQKIKLLYCLLSPEMIHQNKLMQEVNATLVDEKLTYRKMLTPSDIIAFQEITEYKLSVPTSELYDLAQQSAEYSRFKTDLNFPENSYIKLYTQWMDNSVNKSFADCIYVFNVQNKIKGMITLKNASSHGIISLIGVDTQMRGQQIGTKLIDTANNYFYKQGFRFMDVVTQKANAPACNFYTKNGFAIHSLVNVYHLWL